MITAEQIIKTYLTNNGYDGLFYEDECACLSSDLAPCGHIQTDCKPGHRMDCDCGEDCNFHVGAK